MTRPPSKRPIALVALTALACGSTAPTTVPATPIPTATAGATATVLPDLTPASSPTPVPGSSAGPEDGIFRTELTLVDGSSPLPVVLRDLTGLVSGIGSDSGAIPMLDEGVANPDGRPNVLTYSWVGGACDTVTTITFERAADGFRLSARTETTGGICILIGYGRGLEIRFDEPVEAGSVIVDNP